MNAKERLGEWMAGIKRARTATDGTYIPADEVTTPGWVLDALDTLLDAHAQTQAELEAKIEAVREILGKCPLTKDAMAAAMLECVAIIDGLEPSDKLKSILDARPPAEAADE